VPVLRRTAATLGLLGILLAGCTNGDEPAPPDETTGPEDDADGATPAEPEEEVAGPLIDDLTLCVIGEDDCPGEDSDAAGSGVRCEGVADTSGLDEPIGVVGTITFDDSELLRVEVTAEEVAERDGGPIALRFVLGVPMPAGDYACTFASDDDEEVGASLELDGSTEVLWEHRVCDRDDAVELRPGVLACLEDVEELPEGTTAFACSTGVRVDEQLLTVGYEAELDAGEAPAPIDGALDPGDLPLVTASLAVDATLLGGEEGDPLPAGAHTCRFGLEDGSEVTERTVRVD
jgi:hypothetical protein